MREDEKHLDSSRWFDRRKNLERRAKHTKPLEFGAARVPRKKVRKKEDRVRDPLTERHNTRILLVAMLLILLCATDALYTLFHVSRGAAELNPLMRTLLMQGPWLFFGIKYLLSALCIVLLIVYRTHPLAKIMTWLAVAVYGALFFWHIFLYLS